MPEVCCVIEVQVQANKAVGTEIKILAAERNFRCKLQQP
jgi:hypothetical protein